MMTRKLFALSAFTTLLAAASVQAQMAPHGSPAPASAAAARSGGHLAVGVVRAVDVNSRTVTIAHQAIAGTGMPAMTMPFKLDDGVSISSVKPGDTVAFILGTGNVISSLQPTSTTASAGGQGAGNAMPGMPEMHSKSGMAMMQECREMMKRN